MCSVHVYEKEDKEKKSSLQVREIIQTPLCAVKEEIDPKKQMPGRDKEVFEILVEIERKCVYVCMCMCVIEREGERERSLKLEY